jgi:hypothetical protein
MQQFREERLLDRVQVLNGQRRCAQGLEAQEGFVEERVLVFFPVDELVLVPMAGRCWVCHSSLPPLNFHDPIQESNNLLHATLPDEVLSPGDGFVPEKQPQLVELANLDKLRLLYLPQV